jgi:hypothetical protein
VIGIVRLIAHHATAPNQSSDRDLYGSTADNPKERTLYETGPTPLTLAMFRPTPAPPPPLPPAQKAHLASADPRARGSPTDPINQVSSTAREILDRRNAAPVAVGHSSQTALILDLSRQIYSLLKWSL